MEGSGAEGKAAGMTAKERRLAKRAAQRGEVKGEEGKAEEAGGGSATTPNKNDLAGMTAKERRLAKRAAQRGEVKGEEGKQEEAGGGSAATPTENDLAGMTAKERRLGKRAAQRGKVKGEEGKQEEAGGRSAASPTENDLAGMTAKERRLAKRAAQRGEVASVPSATNRKRKLPPSAARTSSSGKGLPHIVFVGQLAFSTKAEEIEELFRKQGRIEGAIKVRLLTKPGTKRSRGMAFVELESAEAQYKCLALHHARLQGRIINVELSAGGKGEAKKAKLAKHKEEQRKLARSTTERIIDERKKEGLLEEGELDEAAIDILNRFSGKVAEKALLEYCEKPDKATLRNRSAYFTHLTHKIAFEEDPMSIEEDLKERHEKQKEQKSGKKNRRGPKKKGVDKKKGGDSGKERSEKKAPAVTSDVSGGKGGSNRIVSVKEGTKQAPKQQAEVQATSTMPEIKALSEIFPSMRGRGGRVSRGTRS